MLSFGIYVITNGGGASGASFVASLGQNSSNSNNTQVAVVTKKVPKSTPVNNTPTVNPTPIVVPKKTGQYVDGTYTGSVADAYYGNVQVEVTVSGGKISDVKFLDYPQDRNTSIRINSYAIPNLIAEAISAQSANVNRVSGASDTSAAFKQSLADALSQAKA